jgi:glycosyltransferase involved in cell wall biosynthesis
VQYMACGVPAIASPVGVTREMIRDGENGFLAADDETWSARLEQLLDDSEQRSRIAVAARADAVARWSLQLHAPRFVNVVRAAMESA